MMAETSPTSSPDQHGRAEGSSGGSGSRVHATLQACDRCRQKKTRCVPVDESPVGSSGSHRSCRVCAASELECTFEMPLTASRAKRVSRGAPAPAPASRPRMTFHSEGLGGSVGAVELAEQAGQAVVTVQTGAGTNAGIDARPRQRSVSPHRDVRVHAGGLFPRSGPNGNDAPSGSTHTHRISASPIARGPRRVAVREGPTSLPYILHATPTIPLTALSAYRAASHRSISLAPTASSPASGSGDGVMLHHYAPVEEDHPFQPPGELMSPSTWTLIVRRLVEAYLAHETELLPIVLPGEVDVDSGAATGAGPGTGEGENEEDDRPNPLVLAMAAISASRKDCPNEIYWTLRTMLNREIAEQGVMDISTIENVQVLALSCVLDDLCDGPSPAPVQSIARARAARAVRLALDLGLDAAEQDKERRIWRCVVILDTWLSAKYGARTTPLPPIERTLSRSAQMTPFDAFHDLSLLLHRLLALVYSPSGLRHTADAALVALATDLTAWRAALPASLAFTGRASSLAAGALNVHYAALLVLLYRPFMRWSFIVPHGMSLDLDLAVWRHMCDVARGAFDWASATTGTGTGAAGAGPGSGSGSGGEGDGERSGATASASGAGMGAALGLGGGEVQDLGPFGAYGFALCGWIAYHNYARRRDPEGREMLHRGVGAVRVWKRAVRKLRHTFDEVLFIFDLLYGLSTSGPRRAWAEADGRARGLNPTPGVLNRLPETTVEGITFLRDPSHPAGGILVATQKAAAEMRDLPEDTIIIGGRSRAAMPVPVGSGLGPDGGLGVADGDGVGVGEGGGGRGVQGEGAGVSGQGFVGFSLAGGSGSGSGGGSGLTGTPISAAQAAFDAFVTANAAGMGIGMGMLGAGTAVPGGGAAGADSESGLMAGAGMVMGMGSGPGSSETIDWDATLASFSHGDYGLPSSWNAM